MKYTNAIAGLIAALLLTLSVGADFLPTEANIRVLGLSYDPAPAQPGRTIEVSLKVDNFAANAAPYLMLEVRTKYPFSLKPDETGIIDIGELAPKKTVYREFDIIIADDAPEDTYHLDIVACPDRCDPGKEIATHELEVSVESGAEFTLSAVSFAPEVLVPGGEATVALSLSNIGYGKAQDAQLEISTTPKGSTASDLFYLVNTGNIIDLGDIGPRSDKKITFALGVGDKADGIYALPLTLTYRSKGTTVTKALELALNVRKAMGRDLLVAGTTTDPVRIPPGGDAAVYLTLKSASDVPLRSITVGLVLSAETIPFATSQSSAERVLDTLAPGAEGTVQFELEAAGTAAPGIYKVPVGISYLDSLGERFTRLSILTLVVGSKPSLDLRVAAPDLFKKGTTQDVSIELLNVGAEEARSVVAQLLVPEGVKVLSSPKAFVESLAANAKATLTYSIHVPEGFGEAVSDLELQLRFSDTQNHQYTEEKPTQLRLYAAGDPMGELTGEVPRLQIGLEKSPLYKAGQKGTVTLNFVNKGTENIKFLTVTVAPTDALEVLSSTRIYVGKMDSDDFETAEFELKVKADAAPGMLAFPVTVEYQDSSRKIYTQKENIELTIYGAEDIKRLGLEFTMGTNMVIGLVFGLAVFVGVLYGAYRFFWRRGSR